MLIIAIPKGRMALTCLNYLLLLGIITEDSIRSRSLILNTTIKGVCCIPFKALDIPFVVSRGTVGIGIAGSDVIQEHSTKEIYTVGLGMLNCQLEVCSAHLNALETNTVHIASKYLKATLRFFQNWKNLKITKLNGSIEVAPLIKVADYIVDVVSSGETARSNGLFELREVGYIYTNVIINKNIPLNGAGSKVLGLLLRFIASLLKEPL